MTDLNRRTFLKESAVGLGAVTAGGLLTESQVAKAWASETVRVGVIGAGGRALSLNQTFAANPNVEIVWIADLDSRHLPNAVELVTKLQGKTPKTTGDFRNLIDDKSLDAIVAGTPDHWHAIPTIMACQAGKDVYVEKPDSHNIVEGMRMVAAMKKHGRVVQMGSQHRATTRLQSALEFIKEGHLGKCLVAKAWESTKQGSIGNPPDGEAPKEVDYDLWLGSAPQRRFNPMRFHGNWRWFYDYGTGDLGNDGVHRLDMAFALLNASLEQEGEKPMTLPESICATGGKWYFDDAQEFPDTLQVNYQYPGKPPRILTYEMRIWAPYSFHEEGEGSALYGDKGYIIVGNRRWRAFGKGGELIGQGEGDSHEAPHVQNFVECIKSRARPYCDLETVGHPASVLCHAGNISARLGRQLKLDVATEMFIDDDEANALRGRPEWRKPWVLPEV
ncbi:MAG: Gfo/Idh/MocA family oxidoreductase [Planctomycetota bacterium]|nr:Gfo/Idh/MocA family oxidoreductase [Planctomycetota bacterium]MDA1213643.1 Gfo/Idh/MocA family oxidoreductase [Planctomycetota bacterium]